ncbi:uncharacterized protein, PEP-CTERM system associated [Limimonas halophila]|uniref:Uncharacterized protein, PEP-CTERM system associated n=1 Tax=Limimonas halophila TaxID=1082479 RepID=A0A1G7RWY0_9PROT|nr:outer membrane beta-barrel protein [Limimonas halophila]SDG15275.1 uncharacterized protein, PEP-CTERM system associated [Limimonas halophila]
MATLVSLTTMLAAQPAPTQDLKPGQTVRDREHQPTAARGVRLGSFTLEPALELATAYDDNIRASSANRAGDLVSEIRPRLALTSDWANHALTVRGGAEVVRHAKNPGEDRIDADLDVNGRLDPTPASKVTANLHLARDHESRADPNDPGGAEPTPINRVTGEVTGTYRFADFTVDLAGIAEHRDFEDVPAATGGTIDNDARDRTTWRVSARGAYRVWPGLKSFVEATYGRTSFAGRLRADGLDRDGQSIELVSGTSFAITGMTFGEAFAGVQRETYDDPRLGRTVGAVSGASLTSTITPLITLKLQMDRTLQLTTVPRAVAFRSTAVRFGYDHELLRQLMLGLDLAYTRNSFIGTRRLDESYDLNFTADYRLNRTVHLTARIARNQRVSTGDADFTRHRVGLGVRLQY